jgi:hypothetical protein
MDDGKQRMRVQEMSYANRGMRFHPETAMASFSARRSGEDRGLQIRASLHALFSFNRKP